MCPWPPPPDPLRLAQDEVHVLQANLDLSASAIAELGQTLAPDERVRAGKLRRGEIRSRFIAARGTLRAVLARYLGRAPSELRFCLSSLGKPALTTESGGDGLEFSLSHSNEWALYALARGRALGVDVEVIRADVEIDRIARRFFAAGEQAELFVSNGRARTEAFFDLWTRKEAYLKGRGLGLSFALLRRFTTGVSGGGSQAWLEVRDGTSGADPPWFLRSLQAGPGRAAALAVEGHACRVRCWHWPRRT